AQTIVGTPMSRANSNARRMSASSFFIPTLPTLSGTRPASLNICARCLRSSVVWERSMWFLTFLMEMYFNPTRLTTLIASSMGKAREVYVATPIFNSRQGSASSVAYAANDLRLTDGIAAAASAPVLSRSRREKVVIVFSSGNQPRRNEEHEERTE